MLFAQLLDGPTSALVVLIAYDGAKRLTLGSVMRCRRQYATHFNDKDDRPLDEITLRDLLAWDDRLRPIIVGPEAALSREVSWAVAARAMAPALPALRGGEIILLPNVVLVEQGVSIQTLLTDLFRQQVAAVVVDGDSEQLGLLPDKSSVPVLTLGSTQLSVEIESELNRLLTERRGELYRLGTELGRLLSGLTATRAGLKEILQLTHEEIATPIIVTDRSGIVLAAASNDPERDANARRFAPSGGDPNRIEHPLRGGGRVWLGPIEPEQRARARVAADRLAVAIEAALTNANWFRPRGPERAEALKTFVISALRLERSEARVQSVALGLDPNSTFRIALSRSAKAVRDLQRCYGPHALVHDLARFHTYEAALIEIKPAHLQGSPTTPSDAGRSGKPDPVAAGSPWIATSAPVTGLTDLSEASRQAMYVAGLLDAGLIHRSAVSFDRMTEVGAFRLLYRFWGSDELARFAAEILGDLVSHDQNGVLRETLLHFLESGGSRVEAAERAAIHRNTLTYRLRRIRELTKLDPTEPADRLSLHVAVLATAIPAMTPAASF